MITLEARGKKYKIPNQLSEITISDFQTIKNFPKRDNNKIIFDILSLYEMPVKDINKLSKNQAIDIAKLFTNMLEGKNHNNLIDPVLKFDGKFYLYNKEFSNLEFQQFIDLNEFTADEKKTVDNLHIIVAILYDEVIKVKKTIRLRKSKRKIKYIVKEYDSKDVLEKAELFKSMTMDNVFSLLFFFINLRMISLKNTVGYLNKEMMKEMEKKK